MTAKYINKCVAQKLFNWTLLHSRHSNQHNRHNQKKSFIGQVCSHTQVICFGSQALHAKILVVLILIHFTWIVLLYSLKRFVQIRSQIYSLLTITPLHHWVACSWCIFECWQKTHEEVLGITSAYASQWCSSKWSIQEPESKWNNQSVIQFNSSMNTIKKKK